MKRIILISALSLMFTQYGSCQNLSNSGDKKNDQDSIERVSTFNQQQFELFKKEMELKVFESEKEKMLHQKEIDLTLREYKQEKTLLDWIAIGVGGLTFLSLYGFWQRVKSMAEKKIEERFEVILQEKKEQLIKIIDSHDDEEKLKRTKRLRIIIDENSDPSFLLSFFKKFDFKHVEIIDVNEQFDMTLQDDDYDILFLNREEGNSPLSDVMSKKFISNLSKDSIVFSFGQFVHNYDDKAKKRFAAATNWSQLYGNLISALKYQELIDIK
jgi:hypothetical protein